MTAANTSYTLNAAASGLTGAASTGFNVIAAAPNKLAFGAQPAGITAGPASTAARIV